MLLTVVMSSCSKQFLEIAPESNANVQAFYKTAADIEVAVNAAYASLMLDGQYRYSYWQMGEVRSDNTLNWDGAGNFPDAEVDQFKEVVSNFIVNAAWIDNYRGILLCNVVIDRIGSVSMTEELRQRYTGEVLFLRALMYFNLVRVFGDVPLVTTETKSVQEGYNQGRRPVSEVYQQIIDDLSTAAQQLPVSYTGNDIGRATRGAAQGLLGKVYLTTQNFTGAVSALKLVVDANNYQLLANYADLWRVDNANHRESLFEVQFKKGGFGTGSAFNNHFAPRNSGTSVTRIGFAHGRNTPTTDMVTAYEEDDVRKYASLATSYVNSAGTIIEDPYTIKFRDMPFVENDADNNWPVLRYADVLLMYAEAINEANGSPDGIAYNAVNAVRQRAGLDDLPDGLNKENFALALERERRVELAFEGHRWFDLLRTGRALTVMNNHFSGVLSVQAYQLLYPVPESQININPSIIKQNPGY